MNKITVLIADNHAGLRNSLKLLIETDENIKVIGEAEDGREAITLTKKLQPDIVLMDIDMPVLNGFDATRVIRKHIPQSKVVIHSMYSDDVFVRGALEAGASGFLVKESAPEDLLNAIYEVGRGNELGDTSVPVVNIKGFSSFGLKVSSKSPAL